MEEVKGRKRRDTKLGVRDAMIRARMERMRVCGESFSLNDFIVFSVANSKISVNANVRLYVLEMHDVVFG